MSELTRADLETALDPTPNRCFTCRKPTSDPRFCSEGCWEEYVSLLECSVRAAIVCLRAQWRRPGPSRNSADSWMIRLLESSVVPADDEPPRC